MADDKKLREIQKRGYELGNDKPAHDKLPPVRDPGPGAGATQSPDDGSER